MRQDARRLSFEQAWVGACGRAPFLLVGLCAPLELARTAGLATPLATAITRDGGSPTVVGRLPDSPGTLPSRDKGERVIPGGSPR